MMGKWWLVTFSTYGSWLPGDPRGFKTWRKRKYAPPPDGQSHFGEPTYNPEDYTEEHERTQRVTKEAVTFSENARRHVLEAIVEDVESLAISPAILAVAGRHVHMIAKFGGFKIRPTVGRFRFAATKRLTEHELHDGENRLWAKGCHMQSLPNKEAFLQALEYVRHHVDEGAEVYIWQLEYADDALPF